MEYIYHSIWSHQTCNQLSEQLFWVQNSSFSCRQTPFNIDASMWCEASEMSLMDLECWYYWIRTNRFSASSRSCPHWPSTSCGFQAPQSCTYILLHPPRSGLRGSHRVPEISLGLLWATQMLGYIRNLLHNSSPLCCWVWLGMPWLGRNWCPSHMEPHYLGIC